MSRIEAVEHRLWVVESNGTPRSGKGTITQNMAKMFIGAAQDETGADYRAVTHGLLATELIDPEMPDEQLATAIDDLGVERVASFAADRYAIDQDELYEPRINTVVARVSPLTVVRQAVKEGFAERVKARADDDNTHVLFVDGRNLDAVIRKVKGANLLLRLFIECQDHVAASRELMRAGLDISDPSNEDLFVQTVKDVRKRKRQDEARSLDPVKKENDAIQYWFNSDVVEESILRHAEAQRIPYIQAALELTGKNGSMDRTGGHHGVGAKATAENRQVYFETSGIEKEPMLDLSRRMVDEALDWHTGNFRARYPELISLAE